MLILTVIKLSTAEVEVEVHQRAETSVVNRQYYRYWRLEVRDASLFITVTFCQNLDYVNSSAPWWKYCTDTNVEGKESECLPLMIHNCHSFCFIVFFFNLIIRIWQHFSTKWNSNRIFWNEWIFPSVGVVSINFSSLCVNTAMPLSREKNKSYLARVQA